MTTIQIINRITVGNLSISPHDHGGFWIQRIDGPDEGEGMQVSEPKLKFILEKLWAEDF